MRVRQVPPTPGSDCDIAYAVQFDQRAAPVTVEYAKAGNGRFSSSSHARHLVQDYLQRGELPPSTIVVDPTGRPRPR